MGWPVVRFLPVSPCYNVGVKMPLYEDCRAQRRFGSLDGIRCLSILGVIWHHSPGELDIGTFGTRGFLGVDMFFVLSGYLIVTLLLRERDKKGSISLKAFFMRRVLRIMPLYYGVVFASAGVFIGLRPEGDTAQSMREAPPFLLTYTTNWVPTDNILEITWSLSAEEQFYLVWPPLQKYAPKPVAILILLIVVGQLFAFGAFDAVVAPLGVGPDEPGMLRQTTFTPMLLGVLLAHLLHHRTSYDLVAKVVGWRWAPVIVGVVLATCLMFLPKDLNSPNRFLVQGLMTALLASVVLREDHVLARPLSVSPVVRIGVLSYGMYLLHMFVVHFVAVLGQKGVPAVLLFPLAVLGTMAVAELSFRFYETPFLKLKDRKFSRA